MPDSHSSFPHTLEGISERLSVNSVMLSQLKACTEKTDEYIEKVNDVLFGHDSNNIGLVAQVNINSKDIARLNGSIKKLEDIANRIEAGLKQQKDNGDDDKGAGGKSEDSVTFKYLFDKFSAPVITAIIMWIIFEGIPLFSTISATSP